MRAKKSVRNMSRCSWKDLRKKNRIILFSQKKKQKLQQGCSGFFIFEFLALENIRPEYYVYALRLKCNNFSFIVSEIGYICQSGTFFR